MMNADCVNVDSHLGAFAWVKSLAIQRVLNRWSKLSEQKLRFFSKVKIKKKMVLIRNDGHIGFI